MSETAPTLTEINVLIRNWLSLPLGTEGGSAPFTTNNGVNSTNAKLDNGTYGLAAVNTRLTNGLNSTSTNLTTLLNAASTAASGMTTLINRTASGGGGSGFAYDLDQAVSGLYTEHISDRLAIESARLDILDKIALLGPADQAKLDALLAAVAAAINSSYSDTYTNAVANRDAILERIDDMSGADDTAVLAAIDSKGNDVITNVLTNRTQAAAAASAASGQAVEDLEDTLAGIATGTADVIGRVDERTDELLGQLGGLPATIKLDADAQTAWVLDHTQEQLNNQRNTINADQEYWSERQKGEILTRTDQRSDTTDALLDTLQLGVTGLGGDVAAVAGTVQVNADLQSAWVIDHVNERTDQRADQLHGDIEYTIDEVSRRAMERTDQRADNVLASVSTAQLGIDQANAQLDILVARGSTGGTFIPRVETTWEGVFEFNEPADYYEVDYDAIPPGRPRIPIGDEEYLPHLGWCALRHGPSFERGPLLEFSRNTVPGGKLRASGLLIYSKPGTTGIVRAYDLA